MSNHKIRHDSSPTAPPAAREINVTSRIVVIDAGTKHLPFTTDHNGVPVRTGWAVAYDPTTATATVWRDEERTILGYKPLPAMPPLTEQQCERVARELRARTLRGSWEYTEAEPLEFWDDSLDLPAYLQEAAATIEHPSWCSRVGCWLPGTPHYEPTHRSAEQTYEFTYDSTRTEVSAALSMMPESATITDTDNSWVEVQVNTDDGVILAQPQHLRELGCWLIEQADQFDAELGGAK